MLIQQDHFSLPNFEGTLNFLICLLQKEEIEICDISIHDLMEQFTRKVNEMEQRSLERGAEFVGLSAYLIWMKSKMLLPNHELALEPESEELEDPHFEIIHHLVDYCRFKQAAKELTRQQEEQHSFYFRGIDHPEYKKPLGIDHLSLEELSDLFKTLIQKANQAKPQIYEENWRISDKITWIRQRLLKNSPSLMTDFFNSSQSRLELVVTFLAILELMKIGELLVYRESSHHELTLIKKEKIPYV